MGRNTTRKAEDMTNSIPCNLVNGYAGRWTSGRLLMDGETVSFRFAGGQFTILSGGKSPETFKDTDLAYQYLESAGLARTL